MQKKTQTIINNRRKELNEMRKVPYPSHEKLVYCVCHNGITFLILEGDEEFSGPKQVKQIVANEFIPLVNHQCSRLWFKSYLLCQKEQSFVKLNFVLKFILVMMALIIAAYLVVDKEHLPEMCAVTLIIILVLWFLCAFIAFYAFFYPFTDFTIDQDIKYKIKSIVAQYNTNKLKQHSYAIKCDSECLWLTITPYRKLIDTAQQFDD